MLSRCTSTYNDSYTTARSFEDESEEAEISGESMLWSFLDQQDGDNFRRPKLRERLRERMLSSTPRAVTTRQHTNKERLSNERRQRELAARNRTNIPFHMPANQFVLLMDDATAADENDAEPLKRPTDDHDTPSTSKKPRTSTTAGTGLSAARNVQGLSLEEKKTPGNKKVDPELAAAKEKKEQEKLEKQAREEAEKNRKQAIRDNVTNARLQVGRTWCEWSDVADDEEDAKTEAWTCHINALANLKAVDSDGIRTRSVTTKEKDSLKTQHNVAVRKLGRIAPLLDPASEVSRSGFTEWMAESTLVHHQILNDGLLQANLLLRKAFEVSTRKLIPFTH